MNTLQRKALEMLQHDRRREIYQTCRLTEFMVTYANGESPTLTRADVDGLDISGHIERVEPNNPNYLVWRLSGRDGAGHK